ncbi:MAG: DinB family protein [Dehalococcoidales bacterium]|nr:DinB family protein [Dehalococcoidales bacterium]
MNLKEYIGLELDGIERGLKRVLDGLTQDEVKWRPCSGCNSIGLILFHIAKSEDSFVQVHLRGGKELWETEKWYERLGIDRNEAGAHYTVEQVNAFRVPELNRLLTYVDAVRAQTKAYLATLKDADFERKIKMPWGGEMPVAVVFSIIVGHASQHIGEMSYLRGMQRGLDK